MEITTKQFAELLNIKEGELVHLYRTSGSYEGVRLPEPLYQQTMKTRKFRYHDVVNFINLISQYQS